MAAATAGIVRVRDARSIAPLGAVTTLRSRLPISILATLALSVFGCGSGTASGGSKNDIDAGPADVGATLDWGSTEADLPSEGRSDARPVRDAMSSDDPADAGAPDMPEAPDASIDPTMCPPRAQAPPPFTGVNDSPEFLQVYVNNVENLETPTDQCKGDWRDLFHYMELNQSPDVFLVQQIEGIEQLDFLVDYMTRKLPGRFAGIIAEASPKEMRSPCGAQKRYQTNAIIYRTGRLEPVGDKHVWQSYAFIDGSCRRNFQARTKNVLQKFHDKVAQRDVTVASLHWSTFQGSGPDPACAEMNAAEVVQKLERATFVGDLLVFGGDMNERDRRSDGGYRPWYRQSNGDLGGKHGFRDAIFSMCDAAPNLTRCLDDNWTVASGSRIDFLFARNDDGCMPSITRAHTITYAEADDAARQVAGADDPANYSDHRAIRAQLHY